MKSLRMPFRTFCIAMFTLAGCYPRLPVNDYYNKQILANYWKIDHVIDSTGVAHFCPEGLELFFKARNENHKFGFIDLYKIDTINLENYFLCTDTLKSGRKRRCRHGDYRGFCNYFLHQNNVYLSCYEDEIGPILHTSFFPGVSVQLESQLVTALNQPGKFEVCGDSLSFYGDSGSIVKFSKYIP